MEGNITATSWFSAFNIITHFVEPIINHRGNISRIYYSIAKRIAQCANPPTAYCV
jgi:hypothetical protein